MRESGILTDRAVIKEIECLVSGLTVGDVLPAEIVAQFFCRGKRGRLIQTNLSGDLDQVTEQFERNKSAALIFDISLKTNGITKIVLSN